MANSGLYRSNQQSMIAGVMGGIAERFGWNANLLRLIFVVISLMSAAFPRYFGVFNHVVSHSKKTGESG